MKPNTLVLTTAAVATLFAMPTSYSSTQNVINNPQEYHYGSNMKKNGFKGNNSTGIVIDNKDNNSTGIVLDNYDSSKENEIPKVFSELETITSSFFGTMRAATKEERDKVNDYYSSIGTTKKISEFNFFETC